MAVLVKTINGLAYASVKARNGLAVASIKAINGLDVTAGGGGGTSPGTGSIVAWYDFADATDADGGTYNLSEQNSPTYTAGPPSYGTATNGTPGAFWQQTALDDNFGNAAGDWGFVVRFRGYTSVSNGDLVLSMNGSRTLVEWNSAGNGIRGRIGNIIANSGVGASLNTWYTVVVSYNNATDTTSVSVNGATFVTGTGTESFASGTAVFGANSTSNSNNFDLDFAGFYGKQLTQDNATWLYNSDGTRTYSEL